MSNLLSVAVVLIGIYCVLSLPVAFFNLKCFEVANGYAPSFRESLLAFVPFGNLTYGRKQIYGTSKLFRVLMWVCGILALFRAISLVFSVLLPVSTIAALTCVALYIILYIFNAVDFGRMFGAGVFTMLFCIIVAPVGYYLLSGRILAYYKSVEDEVSDTFRTAN